MGRVRQGAIFDVDGTLLDSMPLWDGVGARYLARHGITAEPELGKMLYPLSMEQAAGYIKDRYGMPFDIAEIVEGVKETISCCYRMEVMPKEGARDFLKKMREAGFVMAAATAGSHTEAEAAFSRCGMLPFFSKIFTCTELGAGKDRPDIYEAAQAFLKTEKGSTWVFEDALHAAHTAHDAGFLVAGVYDEASSGRQEELRNISDYYLEDFHDFDAFLRACNAISGERESV